MRKPSTTPVGSASKVDTNFIKSLLINKLVCYHIRTENTTVLINQERVI